MFFREWVWVIAARELFIFNLWILFTESRLYLYIFCALWLVHSRRSWISSSVQLKLDAFPFSFMPFWPLLLLLCLTKVKLTKNCQNHVFCYQDSPTHLFLYLILKHVFLKKVYMVQDISENHHNVHTRENTPNGNSRFRIKTSYWKMFPLQKNIVLIFETQHSAKSSNWNEA